MQLEIWQSLLNQIQPVGNYHDKASYIAGMLPTYVPKAYQYAIIQLCLRLLSNYNSEGSATHSFEYIKHTR